MRDFSERMPLSWFEKYSDPDAVVEIVHYRPNKEERWTSLRCSYPMYSPVYRKMKRIDALGDRELCVFLWEPGSIVTAPEDKRTRILGGGVDESCVKARKDVLRDAGIDVEVDPLITISKDDLKSLDHLGR